jgi:hypothetical protein
MINEHIILGRFSENGLNRIMRESSQIGDIGGRINFLSATFLGIDYAESTLIGDKDAPEVFVINFDGVDCFTFIEYVEAMRLSETFSAFEENLKRVRYRSGKVSFINRNHFFTDWKESNSDFVEDATGKIGGDKKITIQKTLNQKKDGTFFLHGIPSLNREISYIPSDVIDNSVLDRLKTGDYAGIYSATEGLDVSHVGIIVWKGDSIYLRHASSQKEIRKVVDQDFRGYVAARPGIMILRPKSISS